MAIIGKNIIENLTTAMYEDSRVIYREYIQNSADSIDKAIREGLISSDKAEIDIRIDRNNRQITIHDNGSGINATIFPLVMSSVADSTKDRNENKGFRGIGRLGGISSCSTLRFSTSFSGEPIKSIFTWDAKLVKDILVDKERNPEASELVDLVTECSTEPYVVEDHFFEVELIDVDDEAFELLDEKEIIKYLSEVAPVPYDYAFLYIDEIKKYAKEHDYRIDEYHVFVNGKRLFKPYTDKLYEGTEDRKSKYDDIVGLKFEEFTSSSGETLAWMWFGISKFEKQIPAINMMRGIRLRKGNIQIGDAQTFTTHKFFDEPRGGLFFIGEVFAVHKDLIPNARRDYFNLNPVCRSFEDALRPLFWNRFKKIYHYANDYKKALQISDNLQAKKDEYNNKSTNGTFVDATEKKNYEEEIEKLNEKAEKADRTIKLRDSKEEDDEVLTKVYNALKKEYGKSEQKVTFTSVSIQNQGAKQTPQKQTFISQTLTQYTKSERKLIGRIYSIINAILPHDMAEVVVNKVQEELSKS